ncbi:MAG: MATE family efflux transporter [Myxococcales bacterium]|nr:MATE family efflux transporter [Myxococcales bacterium]
MRRLFDLSWPIIGLNALQVVALAVDTAMVGRTPQAAAALTGMGYASQLFFLLMVAMIGLTVGTVAFIARAHGARQRERVQHILHQSTQLTVMLGIAVAIVGNLAAVPLMRLLGSDDAAMEHGLAYLRPMLVGTVFNYLSILYAAALRGTGNTRLAFVVALVMNGLNFVFNYGLILGNFGLPALGIGGAAYGTVLAQLCAVVMMIVMLRRDPESALEPSLVPRPFDRPLVADLVRIGWPAGANMLVLNAGFLSIVGMLARIDQGAVAAHGIGLRVQALAFVPGLAISQALGAMVGNALGGGRVDEARQILRAGIILCGSVMTTLGLLLVAAASPLVSVFGVTVGSPVHAYAIQWMQLLGFAMPFVGVFIAQTGLLSGAGATRINLRINTAVTILQIPASYVLGFPLGLGAWGIWAAFPLSFSFKLIWASWEVRRGAWAITGTQVA